MSAGHARSGGQRHRGGCDSQRRTVSGAQLPRWVRELQGERPPLVIRARPRREVDLKQGLGRCEVAIGGLLTRDAVPGPRNCVQALRLDLRITTKTCAVASISQPAKGGLNIAKYCGLTIQISDRQFALACKHSFVDSIRRLLNRDIVPVAETSR